MLLTLLLLVLPALAWAQITPPQAPAQPASSSTAVSIVQIAVLVSAMLGAFFAYKSKEGAETRSWSAVGAIVFPGCATYLAMYSGMIPETWFSNATNALTAAVIAVLVSGLAGAVLVEGFRKIFSGFQQTKSGTGSV